MREWELAPFLYVPGAHDDPTSRVHPRPKDLYHPRQGLPRRYGHSDSPGFFSFRPPGGRFEPGFGLPRICGFTVIGV